MQNSKSSINKVYFRNGASHRDGADVSFADIVKYFGFKSAKVGNWVTKEQQQKAANLFFDAFCDLMDILSIPPEAISLRGSLSLAYGTGGSKHVQAHYNGATRTISLAKNAGGGALAHEWFHAYDHYIAPHAFDGASNTVFASELWLNELAKPVLHPLNNALFDAFESVFLNPVTKDSSDLVRVSIKADKQLNSFYYARPQELAARAFERVVQESTITNHFLVAGTKQSNEAKIGLYPNHQQLALIQKHFLGYFFALGQALNTKKAEDVKQ